MKRISVNGALLIFRCLRILTLVFFISLLYENSMNNLLDYNYTQTSFFQDKLQDTNHLPHLFINQYK